MAFKRLPMRESVIRQTTILSAQLGAVNLSQGFPDDDTFPELKEFAIRAIHGPNHQYTNPWGSPVLREAVARKLASFNKIQADPEKNIVITCGATEGMIVAMEALVERGSEVITFAPMYENYVLQAIASGLDLKMLELWEPDFSFTREDLEKLYNPRTRAVLSVQSRQSYRQGVHARGTADGDRFRPRARSADFFRRDLRVPDLARAMST